MFDLTSSKLLILGAIALIVVGPKDLPILLRTIGKYVGMMRRQANEFRAQFDEAIRETELEQIKKDVENIGREAETAMRETEHSINTEISTINTDVDKAISASAEAAKIDPQINHDALNGLLPPLPTPSTHLSGEPPPAAQVEHRTDQSAHGINADTKTLASTSPVKTGA
jgi:sec-independent protein translocase protein TatB